MNKEQAERLRLRNRVLQRTLREVRKNIKTPMGIGLIRWSKYVGTWRKPTIQESLEVGVKV